MKEWSMKEKMIPIEVLVCNLCGSQIKQISVDSFLHAEAECDCSKWHARAYGFSGNMRLETLKRYDGSGQKVKTDG